jgi:putative ABC transport system ATP-binding protein
MTRHEANTPAVRLCGISKSYVSQGNEYTALSGIDLDAFPGQMLLLLGPSGSGKTTLLTIAAGFVAPGSGTVELFGRTLEGYSMSQLQALRAAKIGFVFQTFLLIDALTAAENIALQLRFAGLRNADVRSRTLAALERVGIPQFAGKRPLELSHGERQRVAIARALAIDADVLIADEPTASLGAEQGEAIIRLLHSCAADLNKCVLVASHDLRLRAYADVLHFMDSGRITASERRGA